MLRRRWYAAVNRQLHDAAEALARYARGQQGEPIMSNPESERWQQHQGIDIAPWDRAAEPPEGAPMDLFTASMIVDGEQDGDELEAYAVMIRTGAAWSLQGRIGRACAALIESGIVSRDGDVIERDIQVTDCEADDFTIEAVDAQRARDDGQLRWDADFAASNAPTHPAFDALRKIAEGGQPEERRSEWNEGV